MEWILILTITAVVVVVLFDFTNGFHDASNIVATVIASRAMSPRQAIALVAFFEFLGPLLGGTAVANTIGSFVDIQGLPYWVFDPSNDEVFIAKRATEREFETQTGSVVHRGWIGICTRGQRRTKKYGRVDARACAGWVSD